MFLGLFRVRFGLGAESLMPACDMQCLSSRTSLKGHKRRLNQLSHSHIQWSDKNLPRKRRAQTSNSNIKRLESQPYVITSHKIEYRYFLWLLYVPYLRYTIRVARRAPQRPITDTAMQSDGGSGMELKAVTFFPLLPYYSLYNDALFVF